MADVRIDKYLWAIRAFKTRSEAADACKGGRVKTGQGNAKPSKLVQAGDILHVRKGAITFVYKVVQPTEHRVGPKLVPNFAENLTPQVELDKLRAPVESFFLSRDRGAGRPTKKDRREITKIWEVLDF